MTKFKLFFAFVFASLALLSCDPSDSNGSAQNDDTFAENFGNAVSKDFIGRLSIPIIIRYRTLKLK
jgi:hypothetical protein